MGSFRDDFDGSLLAETWDVFNATAAPDASHAVADSLLHTTYTGVLPANAVRSYLQEFEGDGPMLELRARAYATGAFALNNTTRLLLMANATLNGVSNTIDGIALQVTGTAIRLQTIVANVPTVIAADTTTAAYRLALDTPREYRLLLIDVDGDTHATAYVDGVFVAAINGVFVQAGLPSNNTFGMTHWVQGDGAGSNSEVVVDWFRAGDAPLSETSPLLFLYDRQGAGMQ